MSSDIVYSRPLNAEQKHLMKNMLSAVTAENIDAVSFEFTDMLVLSALFDRYDTAFFMEDMFSGLYVGKSSFYELRCRAEDEIREKKKGRTYTLDEVYDRLMKIGKISPSSREKLIKRECELFVRFCFERKSAAELYSEAKKAGKRIIITADTPYPKNIVERVLKSCGYRDYEKLYVTSDCGLAKTGQESIFESIARDTGLAPSRILHIGCSFEADAETAINKGFKSLFVTSCRDRLVKSGRLCGYIQKQRIYDFCSRDYLSLRCILSLYGAYAFDYPHGKTPHSDFCGDGYMLGFITLGGLNLYKDFVPEGTLAMRLLADMSRADDFMKGEKDFREMYEDIMGNTLDKYGFKGCSLPFEYYVRHGAVGDRMLLQRYISPEDTEKWSNDVTEPEIAPVATKAVKKDGLSVLADRLFPPGSQVRTMVDGILHKGRRKNRQ